MPASRPAPPLFAACLALAFFAEAQADGATLVPEQIPGVVRVDAEGVIETATRLPELTIIDSRMASDRLQGYIEDSVSLPDTETGCETLAAVLAEPENPALFYCNGVRCGRSATAVRIARDCGYRNLYWFRGGFEEWLEKGYPFLRQ